MYAVLAGFAALENIFPPVPADTAVAVGAFVSVGGRITAVGVFLVTWLANVSSAAAVYAVARRPGRRFLEGRIGRRLVKPAALMRIERLYQHYGTWGIFLSRFIPGVRAVVPPFAGIAGLGVVRSLAPVIVASGIWYGVVTIAAVTVSRESGRIGALVTRLNLTAAIVAVVLGGAIALIVMLRRRTPPDDPGSHA